MSGTLSWLRGRDDAQLAQLLRARPDLTVPAPADLAVLARRLDSPPSVWRAMESLGRPAVQVIEAAIIARRFGDPVTLRTFGRLFGAPEDDLRDIIGGLEALGLFRGSDTGGWHLAGAAADMVGPYPAGLGTPADLDAATIAAALTGLSPAARSILDRLVAGPPVGVMTADRVPDGVGELLEAGLLLRADRTTVTVPLEVSSAVRGPAPLGALESQPPAQQLIRRGVRIVDGTAAGQALVALGRISRLLELTGRRPPAVLKAGGLGIRELRRLAKELDTDEHLTGLYLEIAAASGLLTASDPRRNGGVTAWTPTHEVDAFAAAPPEEAWARLAQAWLDLRRDPSRIGAKDAGDRLLNALAPELSWIRGPADRRFVLYGLAGLPPGSGLTVDDLNARLAWQAPLRVADRRPALLRSTLVEATELGLVAFDALSSAGRALLGTAPGDPAGAGGDPAEAAAALATSLPAPVDTVLIQADLTVVAPGRLAGDLAARLEQTADIESAGSATVYRVTPDSVRRALDSGVRASELHALFAAHSATGVPQALSYLIDDVARRYGRLRTGTTSTYLHSDDPALVTQAVAAAGAAGVRMRQLAPTVAITSAEVEDLHAVLSAAGLAPAAEDAAGTVIDLRPAPRRVKASPNVIQRHREPAPPSDEQLMALVARMRHADVSQSVTHRPAVAQSVAAQVSALREAAANGTAVWIGYIDSSGSAGRRLVEPVTVSGGTLTAFDHLAGQLRSFVLHRIGTVSPAAPPDLAS